MYNCLMTEKYQSENVEHPIDTWEGHMVRDGCLKRPNFCEIFPADEWKDINLNKTTHHSDILNYLAAENNYPIRKFKTGDAYLVSELYEGSLVKIMKEILGEHEKTKREGTFYGVWSKSKNKATNKEFRYLHLFEHEDEKVLRFDTSEAAMSLRYDIGKPKHIKVQHPIGYSFRLERVTSLEILRIGYSPSASKETVKSPLGARLFPFLRKSI